MNLSKSEKIIFSILGVIGIGIVCNKVIYPGFLALKESQSQNIVKNFVQEDFVLPLQEDLQKAGFDDINVSINTFKTDISFENLREYDFDVVISSKNIKEYEDIADNEKKAEELYCIMVKMSNKIEEKYSDYSKRIAINEGINTIVEDEEYDLDRYQEDSEYRKGVDDAMEELDEYY